MENNHKIPLNLQFFADAADAADTGADTADTETQSTEQDTATADLNRMLATNAALQAQFDKKIEKALKTAKSKWDKDQAPNAEAAQKLETFMATMNARAIAAEVKSTGADYGLVNVDAALKLMDNSKIKVADDGTVTGVKEALDALKTTMPFLFGATQKPGAMAQRVSGAAPSTLTGVEASFYAKNPGLKKPE